MLTQKNKQILAELTDKPYQHHHDANFPISQMRLNGFLEHVLLRLYTGFHVYTDVDNATMHQIGLLAQLGLVDLHVRSTALEVTLSSFGQAVMQKITTNHKHQIKEALHHKDQVMRRGGMISAAMLVVMVIILVISLSLVSCFTYNQISPGVEILWGVVITMFLGTLICDVDLALTERPLKQQLLMKYQIAINDVIKMCRDKNGQSQANQEIEYIKRFYHRQCKRLDKMADEDIPGLHSYHVIQRLNSKIDTNCY